mgnify:CR=1 FL=1
MLFAKPKHYHREQKIFKRQFPETLEAVNSYKRKFGYKKLSHLLLQTEAYYLLNVVARKFNRKYHRKAPVITLHDCLITTFDYKKVLQDTLSENLLSLLGSAPNLR